MVKATRKIILPLILLCLSIEVWAIKHVVEVSNFAFTPQVISANVGDTIRWEWVSGSHTTTSVAIPNGAAAWDHDINSGSISFEYKISTSGTYNYVCTPHSGMMTGTINAGTSTTIIENKLKQSNFSARIFPNPVNENSVFQITSNLNDLITLTIYNLTGSPETAINIQVSEGEQQLLWNTLVRDKYFKPGQYFYIIRSGKTTLTSGKILMD